MADAQIPPSTPAEKEILQLLWQTPDGEAKRLSDVHREVGEFRAKYEQPAPAITTVSSTLRGALQKGLLKEVRLVDGKVHTSPASRTRGLVATRSPQTAYQAAFSAEEVLLPELTQLIGLCPPAERKALLVALLGAFDLPAAARRAITATLTA
jgi:hypothetical protein